MVCVSAIDFITTTVDEFIGVSDLKSVCSSSESSEVSNCCSCVMASTAMYDSPVVSHMSCASPTCDGKTPIESCCGDIDC